MEDSYKHTGTLKEEDIIKFTIKGSDGKEYFYWMDRKAHEEERKFLEKLQNKREAYAFIFYKPKDNLVRAKRLLNKRQLVYAYVFVKGIRKMVMIDKLDDSLSAYKIDFNSHSKEYMQGTWMKIKKYHLDRYCTSMDL